MKTPFLLLKTFFIFFALLFASSAQSANGYPWRELSFCPGGGPPGWANYFYQQNNKNIRPAYPATYYSNYSQKPPSYPANYYWQNRYKPYYPSSYYGRNPVYQKPFTTYSRD